MLVTLNIFPDWATLYVNLPAPCGNAITLLCGISSECVVVGVSSDARHVGAVEGAAEVYRVLSFFELEWIFLIFPIEERIKIDHVSSHGCMLGEGELM